MRMRLPAALAMTLLAAVAGCSAPADDPEPTGSAVTVDAETTTTPDKKPEPGKEPERESQTPAEEETADLPDLTGLNLQEAQDSAQAAGFYLLDSADATGQDRMQVWDRNWLVCSQNPAPGRVDVAATVTFEVVDAAEGETCP